MPTPTSPAIVTLGASLFKDVQKPPLFSTSPRVYSREIHWTPPIIHVLQRNPVIPSEHRTHRTQMGSDGKSTNFRWFGDVSGTEDTNVLGESPGEWLQIQSSPHHFIELPVHPRDAGVDVGCCVRFDCPVILKWFPRFPLSFPFTIFTTDSFFF